MSDIPIQPSSDLWRRCIAGAAGLPRAATSSIEPDPANPSTYSNLKNRVAEFVGGVLIAPVIQEMQKSPFKTKYSSGGHGEVVFGGQMAIELSKKIGRAAEHGFGQHLYDAAIRQINSRKAAS